MNVETTFVADGAPSESVYPGEGAFDDPAMAAKFRAAVDATPGDAGLDAASLAGMAAAAMVVGLAGVQLVVGLTTPFWRLIGTLNDNVTNFGFVVIGIHPYRELVNLRPRLPATNGYDRPQLGQPYWAHRGCVPGDQCARPAEGADAPALAGGRAPCPLSGYMPRLKPQAACSCHFKPATMRCMDRPHENAIAMGTP
jgi:hypothetical protein